MKLWPPKPGLTDITSTRSTSSTTSSSIAQRRAGVQHHAGLGAQLADAAQGAVQVRAALGVDGQDVGAGLAEGLQVGIDRRDHQVDVERQVRVRPQRLHHVRADGDVGHEMAVHHVDMHPVGAGGLDGATSSPSWAKSEARMDGQIRGAAMSGDKAGWRRGQGAAGQKP